MMQKTVQGIGNGAHVYVPKEWEGRQVRLVPVERTFADIKQEILRIVASYLADIEGIYLCGSYARNEQDENSDIDILIIGKVPKKLKKAHPPYEIVAVSKEQATKTLENNPLLLLPMIKEAKPIINKGLIEPWKETKLTKKNTKWYRASTGTALGVVKAGLEIDIPFDAEIYSMILRLRGLITLQRFLQGKPYKKALVLKALQDKGLPGKELYLAYQRARDQTGKVTIPHAQMKLVYSLVKDALKRINLSWEKQNFVRKRKASTDRSKVTRPN